MNTNTVELENPKTGVVSVFEETVHVEANDEVEMTDNEFFEYLLEVAENDSDDVYEDIDIDEDYVPSQAEKEFYEKMIAADIDISNEFKKLISDIDHEDFMTVFYMIEDGKTEEEVINSLEVK